MADWLETLRKKQQRAAQLRAELTLLEAELRNARAILSGRSEPIPGADTRPKSRHGFKGGKRTRPIREGSSVWWSQKLLQEIGRPLPIDELVDRVNKRSGASVLKPTLVSNLSRYVTHGDTFTRTAPSTFGLVEWRKQDQELPPQDIPFREWAPDDQLDIEPKPKSGLDSESDDEG